MNRNALATRRTNGSAAPPIRGHVDEQRRIVRSRTRSPDAYLSSIQRKAGSVASIIARSVRS